MGRKKKNILYGAGIGLLVIAFALTIYFGWFFENQTASANQSTQNNLAVAIEEKATEDYATETPPELPDGETSDGETPPEKPDGEGEDGETPPEKPEGEESSGETPPEKPEGEESSGETPPEKPDGDDGETPPEKPGESENETSPEQANQEAQPTATNEPTAKTTNIFTSVIRYILVSIEALGISFLSLYLIFSKGNAKTWKETFATGKKITIFSFSTGLATGVIAAATILILNSVTATETTAQKATGTETSQNITYATSNEITESGTYQDQNFANETANENALSIVGSIEINLSNSIINKTGDSNGGDDTSFYGTNSAVIVRDGATANLNNLTVTTNATGANGVFCYGGSATTNNSSSDGSTINISDSKITTTKDSSGGIMVTGGGTLNASNLTIATAGTSSAAIRSDRGGGTMIVDGGTYTTTGTGSPAIYSTAKITVKNSTLNSETSEGAIIEGKNSITLENVTLTDSNTKLNGQSTTYKNIFLYQSMSGDASNGTAEFSAQDSNITTNNGDTLYVTNTSATITLNNNTFINNDTTGNFLRVQADSWGKSGSNGGDVNMTFNNQTASGNIVVDNISTLTWNLTNNSSFTGAINAANSAESISIILDENSTLTLTADSYISSLENADTNNSNINLNGYKLYINSVAL